MCDFDINSVKWKIKVNNEEEWQAAVDWLKEEHDFTFTTKVDYLSSMVMLTNTRRSGTKATYLMHGEDFEGSSSKEIKLNFRTVVDSVEYPIVKSDTELEMEKLTNLINSLQDRYYKLEDTLIKETLK